MELRAKAERVWAGNRHLTDSELLAALHGADVHLAARTIATLRLGLAADIVLTIALIAPMGPMIYRIAFEPKSDFGGLPGGRVARLGGLGGFFVEKSGLVVEQIHA